MDQSTSPLTPEPTRLDRTGLSGPGLTPLLGGGSVQVHSVRVSGRLARSRLGRWRSAGSRVVAGSGGMPEKSRGYVFPTPPTALIVEFSLPFWVENHLLVETLVESSDPRKAFSRLFEPPLRYRRPATPSQALGDTFEIPSRASPGHAPASPTVLPVASPPRAAMNPPSG